MNRDLPGTVTQPGMKTLFTLIFFLSAVILNAADPPLPSTAYSRELMRARSAAEAREKIGVATTNALMASGLPRTNVADKDDILPLDVWNGSTYQQRSITLKELSKSIRDVVNVKHYGAKGDGVTDDTVAIAAAFAAFNDSTNYLDLYFPPGRYIDYGTHDITKAAADVPYHSRGDRTIKGSGSLSLIQIMATNGAYLCATNGMFNVSDLILYGPGPTNGAISGIAMFGTDSYPEIARVTVYRMSRYGVFFESHRNVRLNDVWLHQCYIGGGFGSGADAVKFDGRLSGNSIGIELGAEATNCIASIAPTQSGFRNNGNSFYVSGYYNDIGFLIDGGTFTQTKISGRLEDSRTAIQIGHLDRIVWTPATTDDSATLRSPRVGYTNVVLLGPTTLDGFFVDMTSKTNLNGAIVLDRPARLVLRNSMVNTSDETKYSVVLTTNAAGSQLSCYDSGIPTVSAASTYHIWNNNPGPGTRDWLQANPLRFSTATGINPGISVFQDSATLYGSTLAKDTNTARWRMLTIAPTSADLGFGYHAAGMLPSGSTNWSETLTIRGDNGGRVGIKDRNPSAALSVSGDATVSGTITAGTVAGHIKVNPSNVAEPANITTNRLTLFDGVSLYGAFLGRNTDASRWAWQLSYPVTADFVVSTHASGTAPTLYSDLTPRFVVRGSDGWVGIGRTAPAAALDVNGTVLASDLQVVGKVVSTNGYFFPTNALSSWPTAPRTRGEAYIGNSNGVVYILTSGPGALSWSATNKLAP